MSVLVTGFEPFTTAAGVRLEANPTADIVAEIARRRPEIATAVLPVAYGETRPVLLAHFERLRPTAWLGLGVAVTRTQLDLEAIALNIESATREDNAGERPLNRTIVDGAPLALRSRLDVHGIAATLLGRGVPIGVSFHAGTFLCNQAFYTGCHAAESTGVPAVAAFMHVPPLEVVALDVAVAAVLEIVAHLHR